MFTLLVRIYTYLFARPALYSFNKHLFKLSLRGLGILNSETEWATGEPWLVRYLQTTNPPKIVFDVGANDYAYGQSVFTQAKIFAFEPTPASFARLKKQAPSYVIPINVAVGASDGEATLYDFADSAPLKSTQPTSQLSTLHLAVMTNLYRQPTKQHRVRQVSLDTFTARMKIDQIDLLKIDAEGNELAVLQGAKNLITAGKITRIQFEFNQMAAFSGASIYKIRKMMQNYDFYRLLPTGLLALGTYVPLTEEIYGFQNIVAIRKDQ